MVQGQHGLGFEQFKARDAQLATQVEQLVLHFHQQFANGGGHGLAQQQADVAVELVDFAHGVHAQAVFAHATVVAQAGGAVVASAGGDLCESVAHAVCPVCAPSALRWLMVNAACPASPCGPGL
jgi:hypothetical protein